MCRIGMKFHFFHDFTIWRGLTSDAVIGVIRDQSNNAVVGNIIRQFRECQRCKLRELRYEHVNI